MTIDLPEDVLAVLREFRTAEFTTLGRDGAPSTWPLAARWDAADGRFLITTSIGYPQKAFNVRRNPRVGLLFSDPTGSGLQTAPAVLVQGDALCEDRVITSVNEARDYWRDSIFRRQPLSRFYGRLPLTRWLMDWYYMRLFIYVRPRRILWWPAGDFSRAPEQLTLDAGGGAAAAATGAGGRLPLNAGLDGDLRRWLPKFASAVLTTVDPDGYPSSVRVKPALTAEASVLDIGSLPASAAEGRAWLLWHKHDESLWGLQNLGTAGWLSAAGGRGRFEAARFTAGLGALSEFQSLASCRRHANAYLQKRNMARPAVAWEEIAVLWKEVMTSNMTP